jgi:hypothetical protein
MPNETTTDPYTVVATALKSIIDTEFAAEGITAIHDQLHEALGLNRVTVGIAPTSKYRGPNNNVVNLIAVEIRFYDLWDKEVDPEQTVNPMKITAYANRLERALQQSQANYPGSPEVWYFDWVRTDFPNDPTGNKTRFHMQVQAHGDNTSLVETR